MVQAITLRQLGISALILASLSACNLIPGVSNIFGPSNNQSPPPQPAAHPEEATAGPRPPAAAPVGVRAEANTTSTSRHTSSVVTRREESLDVRVNGRHVDPASLPNAQPEPVSKARFRATCRKNSECESNSCYVGYGNIGYCTKMCDSWSDCPSHWDCSRAGNSAQKICKQPKD